MELEDCLKIAAKSPEDFGARYLIKEGSESHHETCSLRDIYESWTFDIREKDVSFVSDIIFFNNKTGQVYFTNTIYELLPFSKFSFMIKQLFE